ncbi:hypothetical protein TNCV_2863531 [Trichonephila clavipes]|nr:hypothetical protein TNCV_2863531 [Trichonephila clavipes]
MIWAGIRIGGRINLHIIRNSNLTAESYAGEILRSLVLSYATAIGDSFLLLQDYSRNHAARLGENFLEAETIQNIECAFATVGYSNSHRVREVGGRGRGGRPMTPQGAFPQNWGETEQNRTVTCMVLKAKANDRLKNLTLSRD